MSPAISAGSPLVVVVMMLSIAQETYLSTLQPLSGGGPIGAWRAEIVLPSFKQCDECDRTLNESSVATVPCGASNTRSSGKDGPLAA